MGAGEESGFVVFQMCCCVGETKENGWRDREREGRFDELKGKNKLN